MRPWEILLARLRRARKWPLPSELRVRQQIALWAALRESDEAVLRRIMDWPADRQLGIDNLPEKIVTAYGDLLYGTEPEWTAAQPNDQEQLDNMVEPWSDELATGEETRQSEGEVWWRLSVSRDLPHPVLEWRSRADVVPLLFGRNVVACAFFSRLDNSGADKGVVWRHCELHGQGIMINLLFRGREETLGAEQALTRHPETQPLLEVWNHELPGMLAGRMVRRYGRKPACGVSIYHGVWTRFLELNEAASIGRENMRLTAKKRAVVPASALQAPARRPDGSVDSIDRGDGSRIPVMPRGQFDAGEDVLVYDSLDVEEGREAAAPFKILEYSFDADALIAHYTHVVELACQRCDLVPQFIGSGDFGSGNSGTALKVRLLPTTNAAKGAGKQPDRTLPQIALLSQLLEKKPLGEGGLGNDAWTGSGEAPAFERSDPFPVDETEQATNHATLKTADLISIEQSVRERHPDWSTEPADDGTPSQVQQEVERIRADIAGSLPAASSFGGPAPPPPPAGG